MSFATRKVTRLLPGLALAALALQMAGCATSEHWAVSGGDKESGLVRVSYEYPEFQEPTVAEGQAARLALNRCEGWGYDEAQPIAGQLRQCSNMSGTNCDQWRVTREYQCTRNDREGYAGLAQSPGFAPQNAR
jgi:hypothetical protein